jgi:hypothetical protein|tara:strand:+ start:59 stop:250 length:192 start_codon:yes stop_codon:yes gene_type:complete
MKLSKVILENKTVVENIELALTANDVEKLTKNISDKLEDYLDIENRELLETTVTAAIKELIVE